MVVGTDAVQQQMKRSSDQRQDLHEDEDFHSIRMPKPKSEMTGWSCHACKTTIKVIGDKRRCAEQKIMEGRRWIVLDRMVSFDGAYEELTKLSGSFKTGCHPPRWSAPRPVITTR